jgi:hypothetical protein
MWCPQCGDDTRVLETDKLNKAVTRVRWCRNEACRFLFETHEAVSGAVVRTDLVPPSPPPGRPGRPPGCKNGQGKARGR